ncbi:MAG: AAC(3) family N-acetyltransferase, partial [Chloroflexi bacterium]|nr:AAC(3) family N-acetyltransferase [Chloroflexota bacterium]
QSSFAAWGKAAEWVTADHSLESSLSEESPLARLYELDGFVLLLGVGHGNNTSFHLAEVRSGMVDKMRTGAPVLVNGRRQWQWYSDFDYDDDDFEPLGEAFEAAHSILRDRVGLAECCLFSQCTAVDFAQQWFCDNRRKGNV